MCNGELIGHPKPHVRPKSAAGAQNHVASFISGRLLAYVCGLLMCCLGHGKIIEQGPSHHSYSLADLTPPQFCIPWVLPLATALSLHPRVRYAKRLDLWLEAQDCKFGSLLCFLVKLHKALAHATSTETLSWLRQHWRRTGACDDRCYALCLSKKCKLVT